MGLKPRAATDPFGTAELESRKITYAGREMTVRELVEDGSHYRPSIVKPGVATLHRAAAMFDSASPAMVRGAANVLEVDDALEAAGFSNDEIIRLYGTATYGRAGGLAPSAQVVWDRWKKGAELELARLACDLGKTDVGRQSAFPAFATVAMAVLLRRGGSMQEGDEALISPYCPAEVRNETIRNVPPNRQEAVLVRIFGRPPNQNSAQVQFKRVMGVLDLCTGDEIKERLAAAKELLDPEQDAELLARIEQGGAPAKATGGLTSDVRGALDYVLATHQAQIRTDSLGDVAKRAHDGGFVEVSAPEVATLMTWLAASAGRQQEVAETVAELSGCSLIGLRDFGVGPLAVFESEALGSEFVLVPGGTYHRGLSEREERIIRAAGEARKGISNWFEEYGALLEALDDMRPRVAVTVGPMLAMRHPLDPMPLDELPQSLQAATPFRLPSEAEWEYLARGARDGQLTYRGDDPPSGESLREVMDLRDKTSNNFGCWGFGLEPEVCSDAYVSTYENVPTDGSPHWGEGPRSVRGGAAQIYPWQDCGEWQLLCSAVRGTSKEWEFAVSSRLVLGLAIA